MTEGSFQTRTVSPQPGNTGYGRPAPASGSDNGGAEFRAALDQTVGTAGQTTAGQVTAVPATSEPVETNSALVSPQRMLSGVTAYSVVGGAAPPLSPAKTPAAAPAKAGGVWPSRALQARTVYAGVLKAQQAGNEVVYPPPAGHNNGGDEGTSSVITSVASRSIKTEDSGNLNIVA